MKPLREALREHRKRPIDYRDPDYVEQFLLNLGPTVALQPRIAHATTVRDELAPESTSWSIANAELGRLTTQAERYAWRDEIAAERPEGCFCLGLGGREPRYTQSELKVYAETCGCPDGQRIKQMQERQFTEERRQLDAARAQRLFGKAKVPSRFAACTLDSYPVSPKTRPAFEAVKAWLNSPDSEADKETWGRWLSVNKSSLLLHGPYGVGKTGLAVAILRVRTAAEPGLFFTVPTLLDHIRRTYGPNPIADEHAIVESVKNTPFLVLDDLGAERVTEWVREKLFTIINYRHDEDLPTVFTSNLDVAELGEHIGERTTWRIVEMATVIRFDGPNLRVVNGPDA